MVPPVTGGSIEIFEIYQGEVADDADTVGGAPPARQPP
jgi:hypothetical protein